MRQLIARHDDFFIVALKDKAYLVSEGKGKKSNIEFLSPPSPQETQAEVIENPKTSSDDVNADAYAKADAKAEVKVIAKVKVNNPPSSTDEELKEISAVSIVGGDDKNNILRCAVARNNKTLSIYNVTIEDIESASVSTKKSSLDYRTPKRISCFAFSDLPMDDGSSSTKSTLLISGDVAGDSYAYNLLEKGQRLLLGHTASMLTDIAIVDRDVVECSRRRFLLSADRDEKIRISHFPDSYILEGFLLGHTAYVTAFAAIPSSSSSNLAVSCGGDMTLRLWNIDDKNEICNTSTCDDNNKNEIPTAITVSGCGQIVAVIFDESKRLSIYKISHKEINDQNNNNNTSPSLTLLGSVECPSQPLSLIFHKKEVESNNNMLTVLMGDPNYIVSYNIQDKNDDDNNVVSAISESSSSMQELLDVASKEEISMPKTILEKRHGNPILNKQNETRGPAGNDAPWNRVERIEIAKGHQKRSNAKKAEKKRKKRRVDADADADNAVIE